MYEFVASPFLKVIEILLGSADKLKALKHSDRERAAHYLEQVAACLGRITKAATNEEFDEAAWSELAVYRGEIPKPIEKVLGISTAQELKDIFWNTGAEMTMLWLAHYGSKKERSANIAKLAQAAGRLNGLAATLRLS